MFSDKDWKEIEYIGFSLTSTIFDGSDRYVVVDITKSNDVIFRTFPKTSDIKDSDDIFNKASHTKIKRFGTSSHALEIFQKVLYVALYKVKSFTNFQFRGDGKLASIYERFIKSKTFTDMINEIGFKVKEINIEQNSIEVKLIK